jgi:integrase
MPDKYQVRLTTFSDGERYPLLIDERGLPHRHVTLFTTTQVRNTSKAPNTMVAVLSAIRVLLDWARLNDIDLEERFARQHFLNGHELESLYRHTQIKSTKAESSSPKVSRLPRRSERARGVIEIRDDWVSGVTQYIRMTYVADYLEWFAVWLVERESRQLDARAREQISGMVEGFRTLRPQKSNRYKVSARMGLSDEQRSLLLDMVAPGSPTNPFAPDVQGRNQLIVLLLYNLGLRQGELLALRIVDINFQENTILVARRHDNPDDPRAYQPVAKTSDRRIPLAEPLVKAISKYILRERYQVPGAKQHDFLFVTHKAGPFQGHPLSIKGLSKIFVEIQLAAPDQLSDLTAHVLRHTANDRFSELMDQTGVNQAQEEKMRSYIMGWKEGSGTAATYTQRHVQKKAREAALKLQEHLAKEIRAHND